MADTKPVKKRKLTPKEAKFCREWLRCGMNASEAARRAGYSIKTANEIGNQNLSKLHIKAEIERLRANIEETVGVTKEMIVNEHLKIISNSIAHLHNTWIERKEFDKLTDDQKACISEISTQTRKVMGEDAIIEVEFVKIKIFDKQKALDSLTKMMGYDAPVKVATTITAIEGVEFVMTPKK